MYFLVGIPGYISYLPIKRRIIKDLQLLFPSIFVVNRNTHDNYDIENGKQ
jgi:hypothetical protein